VAGLAHDVALADPVHGGMGGRRGWERPAKVGAKTPSGWSTLGCFRPLNHMHTENRIKVPFYRISLDKLAFCNV